MATPPDTLATALQYHRAGNFRAAEPMYRQILAMEPNQAVAWHMLGVLQGQLGRHEDAVECIRRALTLDPDCIDAHYNLALAWQELGKLEEAAACYRRILELSPHSAADHNRLGLVLAAQGKVDEALACYRRAVEVMPQYVPAHCNWLRTLHYQPSITLRELAQAHDEFQQRHCAGLRAAWRPHQNPRDPKRRLRLGFVSPDLHRHPVGYFLVRLLENLDQRRCEAICYRDGPVQDDDLTARLRGAARAPSGGGSWSDVAGLSDDQLAERIRGDRIDVLFDLAGHTAWNRLLVFARKPAPIQITWLGYEGTTGLEAMDYILADRYTIPAGQEAHYRERVLRMPDGYVCYDPPAVALQPGPLPAARNGYVRFGSFNNLAKITPQVVEVWAKVLARVPQSRLMLKYRGLDDPSVRERYLGLFSAQGIDPGRLEFAPWSDYAGYLGAYHEVDIAMDPFPFTGGVTTCEALWMGVPVVTWAGETFAGRHGLSHLSNVGMTETIAGNLEEYVELTVSLAGDQARSEGWPRLAAMRAGLRERMAASGLCDGKRFAESFADVLRGVWHDWCTKG